MSRSRLLRLGVRLFAATTLAALLAGTPLPSRMMGQASVTGLDAVAGVPVALAQGGMDVGITAPSFTQLPVSVQPGEQFVIGAATAPGAQCAGTLQFRDEPPIELAAMPAPSGDCTWTVDVPPTVRPSTGIVTIDMSRNGQSWRLFGTLWVSVVGENR